MRYYELHVFFSRDEGYSVGLVTNDDIVTEDAVIAEAVRQDVFSDKGDENQVDYVDEISENYYNRYLKTNKH